MAPPSSVAAESGTVDPLTLSVVWNRLEYLLDEMGEKVLHGAQSFVMTFARDFGQGFYDTAGKLIAASGYTPMHVFIGPIAIPPFIEKYGASLRPGDFMIGNDPYIIRSGHLPDWTFLRPVYYHGELMGFFQLRGHVEDTGGHVPGGYAPGAYDIVAEGLNIPPLRIIEAGRVKEDVWGLVLRNVRNPALVEMDAMLINGAMEHGERALTRLIDKYGIDTFRSCLGEIMAAGERAMRAEIAKMPNGTYYGESAADWDGKTDHPVWVRVALTIDDEEITADFSESDPQATFINCPLGSIVGQTMNAIYPMIDASVPKNDGSMKLVKFVTKKGTVVDPNYPATVGASGISVGIPAWEACCIALSQARPEAAMGGWGRHFCPIEFGADPTRIDPRTGEIRQYYSETFASDGSGGAMRGFDGWPGLAPFVFVGSMPRPEIEGFETQVPFWVRRYEFLQDWEGAGKFRGGPGVYVETVAGDRPEGVEAHLQTGNSDGMEFAPHGAAGAEGGHKNEMWIESRDGTKRVLRTMALDTIEPGETCVTRATGGGGWGNPLERDAAVVLEDVLDGWVSLERARSVYGVVLDLPQARVDTVATAALRSQLEDQRRRKGSS